MLIDWFTVGAQALNFVILLWLMKRFLYKPILSAIDARTKRIATEIANADTKTSDAEREVAEFQKKNDDFDKQRAELLKKAQEEVKGERLKLLKAAQNEANDLRTKTQKALQDEQQSMSEEINRRAQDEIFSIARKALTDLADVGLEERMCNVFIRHLRELNTEKKNAFKKALSASSPAILRSSFDLPAAQRTALEAVLKEVLGISPPIQFETASTVIAGVEITANGQRIAWSISDYLASLESTLAEVLTIPAEQRA